MTVLFLKLIEMSVSASLAAAAVILIKLLLKKAPRWLHCLLWTVVAVRLICPFAPESSLSVMPDYKTAYESAVIEYNAEISIGTTEYLPVLPDHEFSDEPIISLPEDNTVPIEPSQGVKPRNRLSVLEIAMIVWAGGVLIMAAYGVGSYLRFKKKVSPSIHVRDRIYICDYIDSPFILGAVRPKIYIPSSINEREAEYVAAHEMAHIHRGDHFWKPIGFALLALHWFNPVMWIGYILLCRDIESACDERVVKGMDADGKKEYTSILLGCSITRRMISACPLAFGEANVKWRIKNVLTYKKPTVLIIFAAVIAIAVASICLLTDPVSARENSDIPADEIVETDAPEADVPDVDDDFVPQLLTEVFYDIDGDGEDEYLVISDPSNMNNAFSSLTRDVSIYKNGYKTYYNIFIPYEYVSEMYFELTDDGLKIARQYKGEWELSKFSDEYLREGRLVIEPTENIDVTGGMITNYNSENRGVGMFLVDTARIIDMGWENIIVGVDDDESMIRGDMQYIVVEPLIPGTQMFEDWEADTFRFWIGEGYTTEELKIGDYVKIVHTGGWGGSEKPLGPANGAVDISKVNPANISACIVRAEQFERLKANLRQIQDEYEAIK